jgi:hypothetical protein
MRCYQICPLATKLDSRSAGAPANEIEITPEMIEAGVMAFCSFKSGMETSEEVVEEIFKKMILAKKCSHAVRRVFCQAKP